MDHIGCEATDWLRGIWSSCKRFRTWSQCCLLDGDSVVQILKGVGVIIVLKMRNNEAILFFL